MLRVASDGGPGAASEVSVLGRPGAGLGASGPDSSKIGAWWAKLNGLMDQIRCAPLGNHGEKKARGFCGGTSHHSGFFFVGFLSSVVRNGFRNHAQYGFFCPF